MQSRDLEGNNNKLAKDVMKQKRLEKLAKLKDQIRKGSSHLNLVNEMDQQTEQARLVQLDQRDQFEQKLTNQHEELCTYAHCQTVNLFNLNFI